IAPINMFDPHELHTFNGRTGNFYFDPAAFQAPANDPTLRTYGTLGRNAFRGPSTTNVNLTVSKVVPIREDLNIEYRADFFNMLNHAQFNTPSTSITGSTFGQISSTRDPRIIQMALRLQF